MSTNGVSMGGAASPLLFLDGDPAAQVAALSLTSASDQRDIARLERHSAETCEVAEDEAQLRALHDKATELRSEATSAMWQGIVEGGAGIASGALAIAGAESSKIENGVETSQFAKRAAGTSTALSGAGKLGGALLGEEAGYARARAANLDADATTHEKAAAMARQRAEDARDLGHDANDAANKALDWYRDYSSARSQATAAALHRV
jgi:hypothetical protein